MRWIADPTVYAVAKSLSPLYFGAIVALVKVTADNVTGWLIDKCKGRKNAG